MNERIKELMRQACKESIRPESVLEDVPQDVLEKFAHVIVRECVDIADEYDGVGSTIVEKIKQHFGVEL
jgi:histone H3/H4